MSPDEDNPDVLTAAAPERFPPHEVVIVPPAAVHARVKKPRRVRRWLGVVAALVAVAVVAGFILVRLTPGWFRPCAVDDAAALQTARRIENNMATLLTKVRAAQPTAEPPPWTIALSEADANAWLRTRLPGWLESESDEPFTWPREVDAVQIAFEGGRIELGVRILKGGQSQVLSASIDPHIRPDGSLWTPARTLSIGRLTLPAAAIFSPSGKPPSQLPKSIADLPQTKGVLSVLMGKSPAMPNPLIKIGDGRRVKVIAIQCQDGRLVLTCQTMVK